VDEIRLSCPLKEVVDPFRRDNEVVREAPRPGFGVVPLLDGPLSVIPRVRTPTT
jgi:hypothetical protein